MLLFGNNTVRIKSYTPFDLGLSRNPNTGFTIEIRQNYFHLLQLPIVATGKTWHIRKGAHLDKMPEPYKQQIDRKKIKAATPLYTYTGLIVIALIALAYYFMYPKYKIERQRAILQDEEPARVAI
jgi:fucose permease